MQDIQKVTKQLTVPVPLVMHSCHQRIFTPFRIYLYLKLNSDGAFQVNKPIAVGITDKRTLNKHLTWLIQNKWIGTDGSFYFVRPFHRLFQYYSLNGKAGSFISNEELASTEIFRAWIGATVISYIIRGQKGRRKSCERIKGRSTPKDPSSYYGVSNSLLAEYLHCSKTLACRIKHEAERFKFIKTKEKLVAIETPISKEALKLLRYDGTKNVIIRKGKPYRQLFDEIVNTILVKKKRILLPLAKR